MNILYIWDADYPWDVRVDKICNTLRRKGYNVHIAARNLKNQAEYENICGIHVHRMMTNWNGKINYMLSFPVFFSPIWKRFLNRIVESNNINVIVVRDLPLAIAGIWLGKRYNIPVIFDMAEDYVSLVKDIWKARKFHGFNLVVRNPYLAKLVELYTFKHVDHVIVVVDEAVDIVKKNNENVGVTIVSNTPVIKTDECINNNNTLLEKIQNRYSIIYTGGVQMGRGIQIVIDAIPKIIEVIPNFQFVVVGDGYASKQLQDMIIKAGVADYVLWVGWVKHEELSSLIRVSKVGVIPHFTSDHVNTTIPNKIFDYMAYGLPVISSDAVPMKRILEEEKCGITFKSGDSKGLSEAVIEIYNSTADWGSNGIHAIKAKYNWEEDEKRLLNVVQNIF